MASAIYTHNFLSNFVSKSEICVMKSRTVMHSCLHYSTCCTTSEFSLVFVCFECFSVFNLFSSTCLLCTTCFSHFIFNSFTIYYLFFRNQIELFCLPLAVSSGKKTFVDSFVLFSFSSVTFFSLPRASTTTMTTTTTTRQRRDFLQF